MKISQIILKGINNFEDFSYSFQDEWSQTIPNSILLRGPNGCGKTTTLRVIADLWQYLEVYLAETVGATYDRCIYLIFS